MEDFGNLEAWARGQGYDPAVDYTPTLKLPEGFVSPHFRRVEFACRHCGALPEGAPPKALLDVLEDVRRHFGGAPMTINSGYRCPVHNRNVGGAANSEHLKGTAADFTVRGVPPAKVYAWLDPGHPGGLGRYRAFTHVDVRPQRARWSG